MHDFKRFLAHKNRFFTCPYMNGTSLQGPLNIPGSLGTGLLGLWLWTKKCKLYILKFSTSSISIKLKHNIRSIFFLKNNIYIRIYSKIGSLHCLFKLLIFQLDPKVNKKYISVPTLFLSTLSILKKNHE